MVIASFSSPAIVPRDALVLHSRHGVGFLRCSSGRSCQWDLPIPLLDDVIIFSPTFEEHLQHIDEVLSRIVQANLGHIVSKDGIATDPLKVAAINRMPTPTEKKFPITSAPVLRAPDFSKEFLLTTDASTDGIAAILSQVDDNGNEYVISYASRKTTDAERNYMTYLLGTDFTIYTDHSALQT